MVLVLGRYADWRLMDAFYNLGLSVLVRETIEAALDRLRHERCAAVVVDRKYTDADILEFVLNVRDVDNDIPVIVIGPLREQAVRKTLDRQDSTITIDEVEDAGALTERLRAVLDNREKKYG